MKADVIILENNLEVEFVLKITASGCNSNGWDEPGWPAEFDIEILGIEFPKQHTDVHLDLPEWLKGLLATHLAERDDINTVAQQIDQERGSYDGD